MALDLADVRVLKEPEEFPYLPLFAAAFVGIAFAGIANTEAGKYWFLKFLILPLYVKLSKKDVLGSDLRLSGRAPGRQLHYDQTEPRPHEWYIDLSSGCSGKRRIHQIAA
jgi:hypothetical protein